MNVMNSRFGMLFKTRNFDKAMNKMKENPESPAAWGHLSQPAIDGQPHPDLIHIVATADKDGNTRDVERVLAYKRDQADLWHMAHYGLSGATRTDVYQQGKKTAYAFSSLLLEAKDL